MDAVSLPPAISLSTAFGAPGLPLPPSQVVQALVLELINGDVFRLQLPQAVVDVKSSVPLTPGSTIMLAVKGTGANIKLTIYGDALPAATPAAGAPVGALPGPARHVIGEAVIVARAPVAPQGAAAELGFARDAPSISPAQSPLRVVEAPPQIAATPERAVDEAVRGAAIRQGGLAPLAANLEQVVQDGALPMPVRVAAAQVLNLRVPLDETLTAADVKQAFQRSGVLFEPHLASAQAAAPQVTGSQDAPAPANDLKAALLVFREVVKAWAGETAPIAVPAAASPAAAPAEAAVKLLAASFGNATPLSSAADDAMPRALQPASEQAANLAKTLASALLAHPASMTQSDAPTHHNGPPPPYRGAPLAGQSPELATIPPDTTPHETAERLLSQADGAIARQTMLQAASLPDQPSATHDTDPNQRWTFEIPFVTPQGTGVAQFEVSRDGQSGQEEAKASVWRARFSLDLEPMGPVHAMVAIVGERASVTLWAERMSTATRLTEQSALLNDALRAAELEPSDLLVRVGTPPVMRHAAPGSFMDRAT